nr:MAG TPA: hypothetical protein [Caudoviricetes sp.]DAN01829.1 MAG TPA: hypothetical protein [Bacteriophage sp.]
MSFRVLAIPGFHLNTPFLYHITVVRRKEVTEMTITEAYNILRDINIIA